MKNLYEVVSTFQLVLICTTINFITVSGECDQTSCTSLCYPNLWERDLCNFYNEVSIWRVSAEGCGIDLPDPPARSAQLSPQEQWDVARLYWDQLMTAWQQAAVENGVLSESEVRGSGDLIDPGSGDDVLMTSEPPASTENTTAVSEWLESIQSWGSDLSQWRSFVESESGLALPDSSTDDSIARLNEGVRATDVRANSREWFTILSDWGQDYTAYTQSFSEMCPKTY